MTHELAKKLKEAGWNRHTVFLRILSKEGWKRHYKRTNRQLVQMRLVGCEILPCPTLSELIDACGTDFSNLQHLHDNTWMAENHGSQRGFFTGEKNHNGRGTTPEEAVAKLWIALNQKV